MGNYLRDLALDAVAFWDVDEKASRPWGELSHRRHLDAMGLLPSTYVSRPWQPGSGLQGYFGGWAPRAWRLWVDD